MLNNIISVLKNKYFYILIGVVFIIPIVYKNLPIRIDFTQQSSLEYKIWLTYSDLSIDTNYILFVPPKSKYISSDDVKYLKKIACKEQDFLTTIDMDYFCNGKYIGTSSRFDGNGKKIDNFIFNGTIPKDKFFVVGTHPLSHDSKYFGFIDKTKVLRKAKPFLYKG